MRISCRTAAIRLRICLKRLIRNGFVMGEAEGLRLLKRHRTKIKHWMHPLAACALIAVVLLFIYYEMMFILPELLDAAGLSYKLHWLLPIFFGFNIFGNMLSCHLRHSKFVPQQQQQLEPAAAALWHLCTHCQVLVPPRAWHCRLCNCCILKRDHHCVFTGSCIGHNNQRYFLALLFHLSASSLVCLIYNVLHIIHHPMWQNSQVNAVAMASTLVGMPFDVETSTEWLVVNSSVIKLNIAALTLAGVHFTMQNLFIWRGATMFTMRDRSYSLGPLRNFRLVLGRRMFWVLLSPTISSPLPHDGTKWQLASKQLEIA
ncbi:probable palmitoyltransferase ZDHHC24 [Drosophila busckii]|uniref:probable palmitoyltransferase ZDHHC24 n=1 Tax=Drosophila busckii TaxID=30019 RepID=UPI00083EFABF|nr:probable palmitoyltransferase ZDHHC24 [Drosophila busckii]